MSLKRANEAYQQVLRSASKFLSPSLKAFFVSKATDDFHCFSRRYKNDESIAEKYISDHKALSETLDRTSAIYNGYRDSSSTL